MEIVETFFPNQVTQTSTITTGTSLYTTILDAASATEVVEIIIPTAVPATYTQDFAGPSCGYGVPSSQTTLLTNYDVESDANTYYQGQCTNNASVCTTYGASADGYRNTGQPLYVCVLTLVYFDMSQVSPSSQGPCEVYIRNIPGISSNASSSITF